MAKKERNPPKWPQIDDIVDYHSLIGGPVTHHGVVVRAGPAWVGMRWCVWVTEVVGCVAIEALSKPVPVKHLSEPEQVSFVGKGPTTRYVGDAGVNVLVFDNEGDYTPESMERLMAGQADGGDRHRPYDGQSHTHHGERGKTLISGLTVRDIADCIARGAALAGDDIRPAVIQNTVCEIERMMGIFPNVPPGPVHVPMLTLGDKIPRLDGCRCHWEEGDSPCPVHGDEVDG